MRHAIEWRDGVGNCSRCGVRSEYRPLGYRGNNVQAYLVAGEWTKTSPKCRRRSPARDAHDNVLRKALAQAGGNREEAAKIAGVGERTIYRFLNRTASQK